MKLMLTGLVAAALTLAGGAAFADHHRGGEPDSEHESPTREDCMAMHRAMMDVHAEDAESSDGHMASMDDEMRARMRACHDMMREMHDRHGDEEGGHPQSAPDADDSEHEHDDR